MSQGGLAREAETEHVRDDAAVTGRREDREIALEIAVAAGSRAGAMQEDHHRAFALLVVMDRPLVADVDKLANWNRGAVSHRFHLYGSRQSFQRRGPPASSESTRFRKAGRSAARPGPN